ncbi:hypothetical protein [Ralstonia phage RSP15]|uniref:hypothetical protein n=1 Tax=Ralstonia phage RSP15 TaxID=1785960 RepID=UPI00074D2A95|nr:hypothetical protein BH754_gp082 [Ralstonia phage RSP15]BAU40040.1 hypothetical protein [Ralstonia phage RSP15]
MKYIASLIVCLALVGCSTVEVKPRVTLPPIPVNLTSQGLPDTLRVIVKEKVNEGNAGTTN